jgi:signal transduction histidine kinase
VKESVADEERVRLARDLHDGVLQSMTGIGLRLAAARAQLQEDGEAARVSLEGLQELIALEQRDLRFFIRELHVERASESGPESLETRLLGLADRIESVWTLPVGLEIAPAVADLRGRLGREVYHVVREGLVNAARHADASRVGVRLDSYGDDRLALTVEDDGRGYPYHGTFDSAELGRRKLGPRSLRERIAALGGELTLESRSTGSGLEIVLPLSL